jgi:hypothetical protein
MKLTALAAILALSATAPAWAQMVVIDGVKAELPPCVVVSPVEGDCRARMAALESMPKKPDPGIPVKSDAISSELVAIQSALLQLQMQQVETNRLLSVIAGPRASFHAQ